ncbi:Plasmodium exported protein, unknown function, partial [Plasmodium vivax]
NFDNLLGIEEKHVKIIDTVFLRSLAKHGYKKESVHAKLKEKLSCDGDTKKANFFSDAMSTYGNLKNGGLSEFELYRKKYNHRYTNKKGLKKLDCYWENKIFDKIEKVNVIAERMQDRKKCFIKKILNKYTIFLFLFALIPALGGIIPELFGHEDPKERSLKLFIGKCTKVNNQKPNGCENGYYHISVYAGRAMFYMNTIITSMLFIVVVLMLFYISVKYIKYQFLKAGISNITLKEYFRLLKNKL